MRIIILSLIAVVVSFVAVPTSVEAGLLELTHDEISTTRDCSVEPCRKNDIGYKTRFKYGKHLRYKTVTIPARYVWKTERVMIAPPRIVMKHRSYRTQRVAGKRLVIAPASGYRVVEPAKYALVKRRVLVAPARVRVVRVPPYNAYHSEHIIIQGGGCKSMYAGHC